MSWIVITTIMELYFVHPDEDKRGEWMSNSILGLATPSQRPNLHYEIQDPNSGNKFKPPIETGWRYSRETMNGKIKDKRIIFPDNPDGRPREKKFLSELESRFTGFSSILSTDLGYTLNGTREVREILDGNFFPFPKPVAIVKELIKQGTEFEEEQIILDFFAGSGSTAQALLELNKEDGGNRRYILAQIPEKMDEDSEAFKAGYKTIADICKERIRRVITKLKKDIEKKSGLFEKEKLNLGFKVYTLEPSNFKIWRTDTIDNEEDLKRQMNAFVDPARKHTEAEDMAWEILLKSGYELTAKLEKVNVADVQVFSIADGELLLALESITQKAIDSIIGKKPKKVIALDRLFAGNDQLKTNTVLQMKDAGIEFRTI